MLSMVSRHQSTSMTDEEHNRKLTVIRRETPWGRREYCAALFKISVCLAAITITFSFPHKLRHGFSWSGSSAPFTSTQTGLSGTTNYNRVFSICREKPKQSPEARENSHLVKLGRIVIELTLERAILLLQSSLFHSLQKTSSKASMQYDWSREIPYMPTFLV